MAPESFGFFGGIVGSVRNCGPREAQPARLSSGRGAETGTRHMQRAEERSDVIIGGGGAVGLALACALADALGPDCRIAVADRVPFGSGGTHDIRASALSAGSRQLLSALGIWPALAGHAQAVTAVDITEKVIDALKKG